jgi:hypothetical protein
MPIDDQGLPVIPHQWVGGEDCCGCLVPEPRGDRVDLVCNKCGELVKTVAPDEVERALAEIMLQQPITSATCPKCGAVNTFPGFDAMEAFTCQQCGSGVVIERRQQ